ncbi:MAG TPA: choice-of-anchor D domain-containing protein [Terriglobales bacterium]|nr:choice-of-anchor D domain-containing protein [Terriglobales bacterium]
MTCGSGTNNWTGTAGDNQWATASNWSTGAVPVSTDTVCIASTFTATIKIGTLAATNQTITSLTSGAPLSFSQGPLTISGAAAFTDLQVSGGTLTLNGTSTITTLELSGGTLSGTGTQTISGLLTWSGGTESGGGVTNANGGMTISGEPFLDTRTLNNAGTATWTGAAFLMLNGSVINNKTGATWNHEADTQIQFEGGTAPTFNNAGTFEKTSGTGVNGGGVGSTIVFNNTGTVEANSGTLLIGNAGNCGGMCGGSWSVASGATLQLGSGGTAALNGGVSGAGKVNFASGTVNYTGTYNITGGTIVSGGTANFVSPVTVTSTGPLTINSGTLNFSTGNTISTTTLTQSGGTLTGSDTVTVSGTLTWSGGTESGSGVTNANGGMTISGEPFLDTRTLNNAGTATWTGAAFLMLNGSVINNKTGATWNHEADTQIQFEGGTAPTFNNAGTFEKTSGTGVNGGGVGGTIVFNNTGTVEANSGTLLIGNAGNCGGMCGGSWSVASGATLQLGSGGTAALNGGVSGAGKVNFASGTVNYTGKYDVTGGTEATGGTANFISPATVTSAGPLTIDSGTLNFSTGKTISTTTLTQSGGTLTGSDTVTVTGKVTWSGGTESGTGVTNANGGMTISEEPFLDTRTLNNAKTATWTGAAFLMLDGSVINNKTGAIWNHEADTQIQFEGGTAPTFNNAGTFEKTSGTGVSGGGVGGTIVFNNTGTVIAKTGTLLLGSSFTQTKGSTLLEGGTISMSGTTPLGENAGSVLGSGTITGNVTNLAGVLSPSLSSPKVTTGTLAISGAGAGNFTQGSGGTLVFDIAGNTAGKFDTLNVSGSASLAGTAVLCLINGYKPPLSTTFPVMNYASEGGTFSSVQFGWSLALGATSAVATYNGAPSDTFSPATLAFPSQLLSTTSAPITETFTNAGQAALTISSITLGGTNSTDFSITTNTCSTSLAVGAKCTMTVTFTPSALGKRSATITVIDDACGSPHVLALSGSGTEITMSPSPVNFGTQTKGTTSAAMTVTLTNHGTTAVTVKAATITGTNKGDFKIQSNGCTSIAASGGTCMIGVTFTPAATGSRTGTLSVTDTDKGSPQTDALEGTGS